MKPAVRCLPLDLQSNSMRQVQPSELLLLFEASFCASGFNLAVRHVDASFARAHSAGALT